MAKKQEGRKVKLSRAYMHEGVHYGPGHVHVKDDRVADDLEAREEELNERDENQPQEIERADNSTTVISRDHQGTDTVLDQEMPEEEHKGEGDHPRRKRSTKRKAAKSQSTDTEEDGGEPTSTGEEVGGEGGE